MLAAMTAAILSACGGGGGGSAASADTVAMTDANAVPTGAAQAVAQPATQPATQPEAQPAAEPAPQPQTVNSTKTIVEDMTKPNEVKLQGAPAGPGWTRGPELVMGSEPKGSSAPDYWNPGNGRYKSDSWWNAMIPWFVIYIGEGNEASNTRVEIRNLVVHYQSKKTGQWHLLDRSEGGVGGGYHPTHLQGAHFESANPRRSGEHGTVSIKPRSGYAVHGWWDKGRVEMDGADIKNIAVSMQARLVLDDPQGPDDRAKARFLVQTGADYWPDRQTTLHAFAPAQYNPGVGFGRFKLAGTEWQAFNFTTMPPEQIESDPPPLQ